MPMREEARPRREGCAFIARLYLYTSANTTVDVGVVLKKSLGLEVGEGGGKGSMRQKRGTIDPFLIILMF